MLTNILGVTDKYVESFEIKYCAYITMHCVY